MSNSNCCQLSHLIATKIRPKIFIVTLSRILLRLGGKRCEFLLILTIANSAKWLCVACVLSSWTISWYWHCSWILNWGALLETIAPYVVTQCLLVGISSVSMSKSTTLTAYHSSSYSKVYIWTWSACSQLRKHWVQCLMLFAAGLGWEGLGQVMFAARVNL